MACLLFTLLFTSWSTCPDNGVNINLASDKSRFCKIHANTLQVENMALEVLSEVFSMILVFFVHCCMLSYPNFPNIFVRDSYKVRRHFNGIVRSQLRVGRRPFRLQEMILSPHNLY